MLVRAFFASDGVYGKTLGANVFEWVAAALVEGWGGWCSSNIVI